MTYNVFGGTLNLTPPPLRTRAILERLTTTTRYTNPRLPLPLPYLTLPYFTANFRSNILYQRS